MSMWNREEAFWVIERLEPEMAKLGAHCALTGSILYRGTSDKDLDIVLYPHIAHKDKFDWIPVKQALARFFSATETNDCGGTSQIRDNKMVSWLTTPKGKRVDFFFLQ